MKSEPRSGAGPFVFNLGHGILPQTPPEHVAALARCSPSRLPHPGRAARADVTRRAVVLMNLGGPDSPEAVRPFLYNLFSDKAIIRLPAPLRLPLAALIASRRAAPRGEIYAQLGGASPLLANTQAQARALSGNSAPTHRCFIAMRYWHPLTATAVSEVKQWDPDEIVLLPLYPQFSTTTTQSSLAIWEREARRQRLEAPTRRDPLLPRQRPALSPRSRPRQAMRSMRPAPRRIRSGCCSARTGCRRKSSNRAIPIRARSRPPPPRCCGRSPSRTSTSRESRLPTRSAIRAGSVHSPGSGPRSRRNCGGPAATGSALSSCRSRLSRSTRRRWSNSTANTAMSRNNAASRPTAACRPSAPIPGSSPPWLIWYGGWFSAPRRGRDRA